jgi:hypothetical protein
MKWVREKVMDDVRLPLVFIKFPEDDDGKYSIWENTWSFMDKNLSLFDVSNNIAAALVDVEY